MRGSTVSTICAEYSRTVRQVDIRVAPIEWERQGNLLAHIYFGRDCCLRELLG